MQKSDRIQGIIFHEKTMQPVHPVTRLRRNIKNLPEKILHFHKAGRHINVNAPVSRDTTDEIWKRLRK